MFTASEVCLPTKRQKDPKGKKRRKGRRKQFRENRPRKRPAAAKPESAAEPKEEPDEWPKRVTTDSLVPGFWNCWNCLNGLTYGQDSEESELHVECPKAFLGVVRLGQRTVARWGTRKTTQSEAGNCDGRGKPKQR